METTRNRKRMTGVVVSDKMDKTVIVVVDRLVQSPRLQKIHSPAGPSSWLTTRNNTAQYR